MQKVIKILFLAANPQGTARLSLDREYSQIQDALRRSKLRDRFELVSRPAADSTSLRRALLDETPDIVHFSGHGEGQAGLVLEGSDRKPKPATGEALSELFKHFPTIKCVLLNACYAEVQARAILQHVDYVIGMKQAIRDDAAIAFAIGFYDGLGYDYPIEVAFGLGCNAIRFEMASFSATTRSRAFIPVDFKEVESLPDHLIPVLLKKQTASTEGLISSPPLISKTGLSPDKPYAQPPSVKADALGIYRERVQEFLADLKLTQIERVQLAILANVLGLSEADANQILQEELGKRDYNARLTASPRSWFQGINNVKKSLFACVAILAISAGGLLYRQTTNEYTQLQTLLQDEDWKAADEETARLLWKTADRQEERSLRVEDFKKISCAELQAINALWEQHSNKHYGFAVQKRIWLSGKVNNDFNQFLLSVGWAIRNQDGSIAYLAMDGQSFDLSAPEGRLPWAVTYYGGNSDTRISYLSRLMKCFP